MFEPDTPEYKLYQRFRTMGEITREFRHQISDGSDADGKPFAEVPLVYQGLAVELMRKLIIGDVPKPDHLLAISSAFHAAHSDLSVAKIVLDGRPDLNHPPEILANINEALPLIAATARLITAEREKQVFGRTLG